MNPNPTIYIAGPLTGIGISTEKFHIYDVVAKLCTDQSFTVLAPHIELKNRGVEKSEMCISPKQIFDWDYKWVKKSNVILAYVGIPSLGVGIELGLAVEWSIPFVTYCEKGVRVSPMVLGHPYSIEHVEFDRESDLKTKIRDALTKLQKVEGYNGIK